MSDFSVHSSELDLAGTDEIMQNNVCVALDSLDADPDDTEDDKTSSNTKVYNLLRGRVADRKAKSPSANDDMMLFKLLAINELDQAIVNISYYFDVRTIIPESALGSFRITGLEEAGLRYNFETCIIEGVPNHLGTFPIGLQFNLKGSPFSKMINLNVITLWKNVDPPEDLIFPKSNTDSQSLVVDIYKSRDLKNVVAASTRGRSHAYDGKPRDDDFKILFDKPTGWYVCAVADGAGSARYSREGSRILVEEIERVFLKTFAETTFGDDMLKVVDDYGRDCDDDRFYRDSTELMVNPLREVITGSLMRYENLTEEIPHSKIADFSTTCLISVFKKIRKFWLICTYNVGDGAISLVNNKDGYAAILCNPDEGKYFGETRFITSDGITAEENIRGRVLINLVRDFDALILMTDGVSDPKFESDRNLHDSRKWIQFYREVSRDVSLYGCNDDIEKQLLSYLDFWSIGNHDDRTLVIVY